LAGTASDLETAPGTTTWITREVGGASGAIAMSIVMIVPAASTVSALLNVIPLPEKMPVYPGTYDNVDPRIEYTGSWTKDFQFRQAAEGSLTYSAVAGDSLRLSFIGGAITYVYTKAANRGMAQVMIDGRERGTVNLYSRETQWQAQTIFSGLGAGGHTIEIRVMGRKDLKSAGCYVDVDRFIVENAHGR